MAVPVENETMVSCSKCMYYREGTCAIKSPQIVCDNAMGYWPSVKEDHWCGEFINIYTEFDFRKTLQLKVESKRIQKAAREILEEKYAERNPEPSWYEED